MRYCLDVYCFLVGLCLSIAAVLFQVNPTTNNTNDNNNNNNINNNNNDNNNNNNNTNCNTSNGNGNYSETHNRTVCCRLVYRRLLLLLSSGLQSEDVFWQ